MVVSSHLLQIVLKTEELTLHQDLTHSSNCPKKTMHTEPAPVAQPLSVPARSSLRVRTRCVLEQATALPFWHQDYTQLSAGRFQGEIDSITTPNLQLFRESMNRSVD